MKCVDRPLSIIKMNLHLLSDNRLNSIKIKLCNTIFLKNYYGNHVVHIIV